MSSQYHGCSQVDLMISDNLPNHRPLPNPAMQYSSLSLVILSLSRRFNGNFPGVPALAGTGISPFWILLELRVMDVVVTTGTISRAKVQSKCHHKQTNTQFFTGRMPFLRPTNSVTALKGKLSLLKRNFTVRSHETTMQTGC